MISSDMLAKIRSLELKTKQLLSGSLQTTSASTIKGTGFEFDQLREYQMGDDIRRIDWNSWARLGQLRIKQYREDRNRTIIVVLDGSRSGLFTGLEVSKYDYMAQLAACLALIGQFRNDSVGLVIYADLVKHFMLPSCNKAMIRRLLQTIFTYGQNLTCLPDSGSNLGQALQTVLRTQKNKALVCIISDAIAHNFINPLSMVAKKHETIFIRCTDRYEKELPNIGYMHVRDIETGQLGIIASSKRKNTLNQFLTSRAAQQAIHIKKTGARLFDITTDQDPLKALTRMLTIGNYC